MKLAIAENKNRRRANGFANRVSLIDRRNGITSTTHKYTGINHNAQVKYGKVVICMLIGNSQEIRTFIAVIKLIPVEYLKYIIERNAHIIAKIQ